MIVMQDENDTHNLEWERNNDGTVTFTRKTGGDVGNMGPPTCDEWFRGESFIDIGHDKPHVTKNPRFVGGIGDYTYGLNDRFGLTGTIERLIRTEQRIEDAQCQNDKWFRNNWLRRHRQERLRVYDRDGRMTVVDRPLAALVDIPVKVTVEEAMDLCRERAYVQVDRPEEQRVGTVLAVDGQSRDYDVTFVVDWDIGDLELVAGEDLSYA